MTSTITKFNFKAGMTREGTSYSNEGTWYDGDMVRFRYGYVENIGGWTKVNSTAFVGVARFLHPFQTLDSESFMFMGTTAKVYLEIGGDLKDITPLRATSSLGTDPLTSDGAGSGVITVTDTTHGAEAGDYVTFSSATAFDGLTTDDLNKEHVITETPDANSYKVDTGGSATAGSVSGGGSSISAEYQISVGLDATVGGTGWSAGTWGTLSWGEASGALAGQTLRLWFADSFGEDLVFNIADEGIYYWDASLGTSTRAVELSTISGASDVPTVARKILVSEVDRHAIAFGSNPLGSAAQDPLMIRWSDSENLADWTPTTINSSGSIRLSQGSEIVTALRTKRETLVWTDTSLHSFQFIGPPYIFGTSLLGDNVTITGPNSMAVVNDAVYWMGHDGFYQYDGMINDLPCPVRAYVFDDFNKSEAYKVATGTISGHTEIWWFYPSASSTENDRYVCYNYLDNVWTFGTLARSAWSDATSGIRAFPQATSTDGFMYDHETGLDDGSTEPASYINSYAESADFDLEDGYQFVLVRRVIPDITFSGSTNADPEVTFSLKTKDYPGIAVSETVTGDTVRTASSPVELYTKSLPMRARGRSAVVRVENTTTGVKWRLGAPRIEARPDGRR
jgi:hypothetical protein